MDPRFRTTEWSLVLAARTTSTPDSRKALSRLCESYWYPLYAFVRRQGHGADEARDLTQGYFAHLLEKKALRTVDPASGRFRSFLIASMKNFLSHERDRAGALKRGRGRAPVSFDFDEAERRYSIEPVECVTPEQLYEQRWAWTMLGRVHERLARESRAAGKTGRSERLRGYLTGESRRSYREVGDELGMSEAAVKMAVHRLRVRFGEMLREEIAATVSSPEEVDAEIRHLLAVVRT